MGGFVTYHKLKLTANTLIFHPKQALITLSFLPGGALAVLMIYPLNLRILHVNFQAKSYQLR